MVNCELGLYKGLQTIADLGFLISEINGFYYPSSLLIVNCELAYLIFQKNNPFSTLKFLHTRFSYIIDGLGYFFEGFIKQFCINKINKTMN
jgi:hypothetical protein